MSKSRFTCACCGYQTLSDKPGNWAICHVCFWEDDPVQLLDPWYVGGANRVSLAEAQENYAAIGASELRFKSNVKGILPGDAKDPTWRRVTDSDRSKATSPARLSEEKPNGDWPWYYWRTIA
jgi:Cysteine-rich CPCC